MYHDATFLFDITLWYNWLHTNITCIIWLRSSILSASLFLYSCWRFFVYMYRCASACMYFLMTIIVRYLLPIIIVTEVLTMGLSFVLHSVHRSEGHVHREHFLVWHDKWISRPREQNQHQWLFQVREVVMSSLVTNPVDHVNKQLLANYWIDV